MKPTAAALAVWQVYGRHDPRLMAAWHWERVPRSFKGQVLPGFDLVLRLP